MSKPEFDDIFMELATSLSGRSHCVKAQVGAVIARDTRIISIGYNGPPSGTHNCDEEWPETGCPRDSRGSCSLALHARSEEHTSELQSLMRISYAVFCLKKKTIASIKH